VQEQKLKCPGELKHKKLPDLMSDTSDINYNDITLIGDNRNAGEFAF
jgi:hypothetical protein